ncbi:right-handed parallel beta-helix repeat-containing protein [Dyadobacter jiangsuensis]|uniref:Putative secreted protein (Por secretion system target) n=1 Tax=Dyadobacter jiangsuensis TaxID=1591085 RepID=A0A2P8GJQ1_9BACT|nr:right-handed parallel beta-helix repeat-containing protein [Dyadobacter jiangsuensis]PSL34192.1 putative secreted protein (Por secretion system target) [Dyadobacter jiangsuensis]
MNTQLLRSLFTLFCALLIATVAHAAVIYNHNFNNKNFSAPTSINSNMTAVWSGIGDTPYSRNDGSDPGMALNAHNHVYVLTITLKERFQAEITSISFRRFSGDNATMQMKVNEENYGTSFSATTSLTLITRSKTVSELRNKIVIKIAVTNGSYPNYYSHIDDFTINGTVSGYDPAAEATPDANGILYVDGSVDTPGDGSSWDNALQRMHYATRAAALNPAIKQVWVSSGTYENAAADEPLALTDGVAYYGGFSGNGSEIRDRNISPASTVLKGLGGTVISVSGAGASTRLDGFMVTSGTGFAVNGERRGGALHVTNSSLVIANCLFAENATDPSATGGKGGAIYLLNSSPLILQCLFTANSAKGTTAGKGGAVFMDNSSPTIRNCTFSVNEVGNNAAAGNGGALYALSGSSPVVENCIIWNNADPASPGSVSSIGGSGTPVVSYSLIQGGFPGGTNILDTDPQFTDAAQNNFVQRKGSPVTNAGNPSTDISAFPKNSDDIYAAFDGNRRLTSQAIDLGIYEVTPSVIWYVSAAASAPDPSGDSWANALHGLGDALNLASEGDQIWVARGEYENSEQLKFIHGVKIYGSFVGTETSLSQRPLPIIHGDPATATVLTSSVGPLIDNSYNDLTREDIFDGFTITGVFGSNGGAMRNTSVSPTIANCAFLNNYASDGAGIYNENASPLIINTIFRDNGASFGSGGAIANVDGSNTILMNCLITRNSASQSAGAIYNNDAEVTLLNCTVAGNTQTFPGTITGYGRAITVRNSIIYGNGSGIASQESTVSVTYSLVEGMNASDTDHNLAGTTNPQFAGETDWTLLPCSPAINRGTNEALPDLPANPTDLAHNTRTFNVQTDMGAYELQAITGPGTLPASGEQATLPVYAGATAITNDCKTFGLIEPAGTPGSLGNVTVKAFLAAGNTVSEGEKVFVKRHYDISPTGADGPAKVTLFFSKQDFDTYNQAFGNANNASLPANLKVVQYHGTSPYGFPGTYSGPTQLITDVTVTESADHTMYLVSFQVTGFSGFFISGQSEAALPVTLVSFQAKKREREAYLQWQTSSETNSDRFEIERSTDGKHWLQLGEVAAKGSETTITDYSYTDALPLAGTNMYRLKMIDHSNGSTAMRPSEPFSYSRIAVLNFEGEKIAIYPNPATDVQAVHLKGVQPGNVRNIRLFGKGGTLLLQSTTQQGGIDIRRLLPGTYTVEIETTSGDRQSVQFAVTR